MVDLTTTTTSVIQKETRDLVVSFSGLLPSTKHSLYVNGEDRTAVSRQYGKDFGDDLISDANGELFVLVLTETPFTRGANFELPQENAVAFETNRFNNQRGGVRNVDRTRILYEVRSANDRSYGQFIQEQDSLMVAGPITQQTQVE